ncbi:AI-2E family transporter [Echinicola strongylocentroti]|uniref:AI-2E family transporter n=1 Tax=Echinicola strongylocentroti TaxID=1795355 RepID=A0A2Z4ICW4_9BACT|nr:AI-2E family transporter [Echinicola strongylocentroti]AWW28704.1 AI-2E family transporter [Echinicola strongylocentroti]
MQKLHIPTFLRVLFVLLLIITIVFIMILGKKLLVPLMVAGLLSILLTPLCEQLEKWKVPETLSALFSLLSGLIIVGAIVTLVVLQIKGVSQDLGDVGQRADEFFASMNGFFTNKLGVNLGLENGINKGQIVSFLQTGDQSIQAVLLNAIGSLTGLVLTPVFVFFMLIYRRHLTYFLVQLFKDQKQDEVKGEIFNIRKMVQGYIIGVLKVMAILAVLNTGALYILGIKHALFFGLFAAILNIIPYLGPFLGAILPFFYAMLTSDSMFSPFIIVILFTIIQLVESNFLTPKIVGANVNLNAFITLLGLLLGGAIWGISGMIVIIPSLAILRRIFELSESTKPFAFLLAEEKNNIFTKNKLE